jgi:hypothetical protein
MSAIVKDLFDTDSDNCEATEVAGYTKLFSLILASTIWREDDKTRIVWITLLALANKNGIAETSIPGLADFARVTIKDCETALEKLRSPDPYSRTKEHDGRRIQDVDGGFLLINHGKYRAMMSAEERREYNRIKQQEHRQKMSNTVIDSQTNVDGSALSAHTEAKADSKADAEAIYQAYPRKIGKPKGLQAIRKALKKVPTGKLLELTKRYSDAVRHTDHQFIPYPQKWFNEERFNDDPSTWVRSDTSTAAGRKAIKSKGEYAETKRDLSKITRSFGEKDEKH